MINASLELSPAPLSPNTTEGEVAPQSFNRPNLSIVVPIYNEVETIPSLVSRITKVLEEMDVTYEFICVDDGSTDGSVALLREIAQKQMASGDFRAVLLRRNYGQSAAMSAGFHQARGKVIVTLDGDLQNEPADIATVYYKLLEGYDLVSGWRKNRQDDAVTRLLPSKIANSLIARVTGVRLHDYGCSLKAYRAEVLSDMHLYGELHRFLPALAYIEGARITEIPVRHHARQFGQSKYGLGRTLRVVMDLLTIYFMKTFLTRPMHVFGPFGIVSISIGFAIGLYLTFVKLFLNESIGNRPLLLLAVLLLLSGIQLFSFGLLAELNMRTYHESQRRPIYRVREVLGASAKNS
ncbi:glycosyl transferase, group 2 family protein [Synechococcus sp. PCC 7335]|uniref:glycosyltransferase family 2 protein n=1 Tax=Synechococcus sp. (strain ATCC 29403 / PCC 7335) TaxID=91464 RepID=UPI00017EBBEA|nr:glycosyltransferase family 2 protein [Synechococcus sp. PCC 7335]EDX83915.1 glycosyl transferase, group 2 family protein [Synechococcus sp. PCC 7335]